MKQVVLNMQASVKDAVSGIRSKLAPSLAGMDGLNHRLSKVDI